MKTEITLKRLIEIEKKYVPNKEERVVELLGTIQEIWERQIMREGIKKGRKEEREKIVFNLLENQVDVELICRCTDLSRDEVLKLKESSKNNSVS